MNPKRNIKTTDVRTRPTIKKKKNKNVLFIITPVFIFKALYKFRPNFTDHLSVEYLEHKSQRKRVYNTQMHTLVLITS